jgi:hypothetical protein
MSNKPTDQARALAEKYAHMAGGYLPSDGTGFRIRLDAYLTGHASRDEEVAAIQSEQSNLSKLLVANIDEYEGLRRKLYDQAEELRLLRAIRFECSIASVIGLPTRGALEVYDAWLEKQKVNSNGT